MSKSNRRPKMGKTILISLAVLFVLTAAGVGVFLWNQKNTAAQTTQESTLKTTTVRQGSLTLSASGAGTLAASRKTSLSFPIDGKVAAINVQVGESVSEGQVLAELQDTSDLENSLTTAELELKSAQLAQEALQNNAAANLANAQLALAEAKKAVTDAKSELKETGMVRCDQETIDAYYATYLRAQDYLEALGDGGGSSDYYLTTIVPAKNNAAKAYSAYLSCAGFSEYEIDSSQATLTLAEAAQASAEVNLETLQANEGIDPAELASAQNKVKSAQIAYDKARKNLDNAAMKAPFDGTILSIAGEVGDEVDTSTFITIADLLHPEVSFSVDETDFDKVAVDAQVQVIFDALPDSTFTGQVVQVNPTLESGSGFPVLTGVAQIDLSKSDSSVHFLEGMNASVEIIKGSVENALLVPVEALRDLGDGQYSVFVVGSDGKPRMTVVEVGLMDATYVEIKSGLKAGDVVSTGAVETN